jgi:hypothetical protein
VDTYPGTYNNPNIICQKEAAKFGRGGTWYALIYAPNMITNTLQAPLQTLANGPKIVNVDFTIQMTASGLSRYSSLDNYVVYNFQNQEVPWRSLVWTGYDPLGQDGNRCFWGTNNTGSAVGYYGTTHTFVNWLYSGYLGCSGTAHYYCISDSY